MPRLLPPIRLSRGPAGKQRRSFPGETSNLLRCAESRRCAPLLRQGQYVTLAISRYSRGYYSQAQEAESFLPAVTGRTYLRLCEFLPTREMRPRKLLPGRQTGSHRTASPTGFRMGVSSQEPGHGLSWLSIRQSYQSAGATSWSCQTSPKNTRNSSTGKPG